MSLPAHVLLPAHPHHDEQIIVSTAASVCVEDDASRICLHVPDYASEYGAFPLLDVHHVLKGRSYTYRYHIHMGVWMAWETVR